MKVTFTLLDLPYPPRPHFISSFLTMIYVSFSIVNRGTWTHTAFATTSGRSRSTRPSSALTRQRFRFLKSSRLSPSARPRRMKRKLVELLPRPNKGEVGREWKGERTIPKTRNFETWTQQKHDQKPTLKLFAQLRIVKKANGFRTGSKTATTNIGDESEYNWHLSLEP